MKRPILCYVTDRCALALSAGATGMAALLKRVEQAACAGVDWIQLREKDLDARTLFDLATKAIAAIGPAPKGQTITRILINDRLDVASAAGAAGVHIGESSLSIREVVRWRDQVAGEGTSTPGHSNFLIGASCHSIESAAQACAEGADYIFFGPVFATPSKQSYGLPQGLSKLSRVCEAVSRPVLAIGGITAENAAACIQAGASGIAAIRLFQQASDLSALVRRIRS